MMCLEWTGTVKFSEEVDSAALPAHLANCLRDVIHARDVAIETNRVAFTGGLRSENRWNVLVPFGFGEVTVDPGTRQILYRLSFRQMVVFVTLSLALLGIFSLLWQEPPLAFLAFGWTWLIGGNLALGVPRFRNFIRKTIATAPRRP
jgi:hypothetical protein